MKKVLYKKIIMKIKYRVRDKKENEYFEPDYRATEWIVRALLLMQNGDLIFRDFDGITHESIFPDRYVTELDTGLTDKNGKKIFEGDVLSNFNKDDELIIEIGFCTDCMQLQPIERPCKCNNYCEDTECLACRNDLLLAEIKGSNLEVIGNIHEDKYLFTKK